MMDKAAKMPTKNRSSNRMSVRLRQLTVVVLLLAGSNANATLRYVDVNSASPAPPYTTWGTAANNIQDAINAASAGDHIWVTNGTYQTGGSALVSTMTNRVVVNKSLTVQSVNGPGVTLISGYQVPGTTNGDGAVRCVYLTNGASLVGFTVTNGATLISPDPSTTEFEQSGAGAWCESTNAVITNCVISGNSAASYGGGAYRGTLINCTLTANWAWGGGGAKDSILTN